MDGVTASADGEEGNVVAVITDNRSTTRNCNEQASIKTNLHRWFGIRVILKHGMLHLGAAITSSVQQLDRKFQRRFFTT